MIDFLDAYVSVIRWTGITLLVVGWLIVSFTKPSPRRAVFEWAATVGLYTTILSFILHGMYVALHWDPSAGRLAAIAGLSLLSFLFCTGVAVSLVSFLLSLRGPGKAVTSATN
ncbi:MAG: hypothetical protein ACQGVC_19240 [Myxococcota bacterium]